MSGSRAVEKVAEPAPAVAWGTFEAHRFPTRDGHEIGAWYSQGREDAPSVLQAAPPDQLFLGLDRWRTKHGGTPEA